MRDGVRVILAMIRVRLRSREACGGEGDISAVIH